MLKAYKPCRIILARTNDPCGEYYYLKNIVLYSLLVSHGIRVDTELWVLTGNSVIKLDGLELRHLHSQEDSLIGFVKSVFCKHRYPPGVKPFSSGELKRITGYDCVMITNRDDKIVKPSSPVSASKTFVISLRDDTLYHDQEEFENIVKLPVKNMVELVNTAHFVLDRAFGAWVRRRGRIQLYERSRF